MIHDVIGSRASWGLRLVNNLANDLLPTAYRGGSTITFERCEGDAPCTEETVERFDVDLAAITAPLWSGDVLPWRFNGPTL